MALSIAGRFRGSRIAAGWQAAAKACRQDLLAWPASMICHRGLPA